MTPPLERARLLARLAGALARLLELESFWLCRMPGIDFKIELGLKIERDAAALRLLSERIKKLGYRGSAGVSEAYERNFLRASRLTGEQEAAAFLRAATAELGRLAALPELEASSGIFSDSGVPPFILAPLEKGKVKRASLGLRPPDYPARPADFARAPSRTHPIGTPEGRRDMLSFILIDIEIMAAEVCAANILLYPRMPLEFRLDMARQIGDECRHARLVRERLAAYGGSIEAMSYEGSIWEKWRGAGSLEEKLCIEQVVMEGNALDAASSMSEGFRAAGDPATASVIDRLAADEVNHVRIGNKWLLRLLGGAKKYAKFVDEVASRLQAAVPGRFPPNKRLRAAAGFPAEHTAEMSRRYKARLSDPLHAAALKLAKRQA